MIEDFFHLPQVSTTPVVHLELQISPRMFKKIWNRPNGILMGLGETDSWKKPEVEYLVTLSLQSSMRKLFLIYMTLSFILAKFIFFEQCCCISIFLANIRCITFGTGILKVNICTFFLLCISGEGETLEGLVLLDTNLVIFGQFTISIFDLRGQLIENKRPQLDGHIFSIRLLYFWYRSWVSEVFRKNKIGVCYHPRW